MKIIKHTVILKKLVIAASFLALSQAAENKPNIIFILMDDMGFSDVGCYGAKTVETPNVDRLAKEGLKFTNFHTGASICTPSRAAFLTGAYPQRAGLYMGINVKRQPHWFLGLNPDEITIAEQCKSQGYKTLMIGKWHLGHEEPFNYYNQGFDSYYGAPENIYHTPIFLDEKEVVYEKTPLDKLAGLYTNKVLEHIHNHQDQPFFLYFSHQYPHTPYAASKPFKGSSKSGKRGDAIQEVDWGIGEMLKALEDTNQLDNTVIIFTSDNGAITNEYCLPFRGTKYVSLEGGHRVPFIVYSSKIKEPREVDDFVTAMDVFPTVNELINGVMPSDRIYDGVSLAPYFKGDPISRDNDAPFYYYNCENLQAVKKGAWKLHFPRTVEQVPHWDRSKEYFDLQNPVLYNVKDDVYETKDVAAEHPEIVEELQALGNEVQLTLGSYMVRGTEQRETGSLFPEVPIISHQKDWAKLSIKEKGRAKSEFKPKSNK